MPLRSAAVRGAVCLAEATWWIRFRTASGMDAMCRQSRGRASRYASSRPPGLISGEMYMLGSTRCAATISLMTPLAFPREDGSRRLHHTMAPPRSQRSDFALEGSGGLPGHRVPGRRLVGQRNCRPRSEIESAAGAADVREDDFAAGDQA